MENVKKLNFFATPLSHGKKSIVLALIIFPMCVSKKIQCSISKAVFSQNSFQWFSWGIIYWKNLFTRDEGIEIDAVRPAKWTQPIVFLKENPKNSDVNLVVKQFLQHFYTSLKQWNINHFILNDVFFVELSNHLP